MHYLHTHTDTAYTTVIGYIIPHLSHIYTAETTDIADTADVAYIVYKPISYKLIPLQKTYTYRLF